MLFQADLGLQTSIKRSLLPSPCGYVQVPSSDNQRKAPERARQMDREFPLCSTHLNPEARELDICLHCVGVHTCMYTCVHKHVCACVCMSTYVHMCAQACVRMHIHVSVYMRVCVCPG